MMVAGLCDPSFIAHLLAVSRHRSSEVMATLGAQTIGIGSAAGFDEVVQRSPGRWDIPISLDEFDVDDRALPWWPLITAVLGEHAEHSFSGVVYSDPGSPAQCWHIDSPHVSADHLPPHALNVMVALHQIPLSMGLLNWQSAPPAHQSPAKPGPCKQELVYQHETTCQTSWSSAPHTKHPLIFRR